MTHKPLLAEIAVGMRCPGRVSAHAGKTTNTHAACLGFHLSRNTTAMWGGDARVTCAKIAVPGPWRLLYSKASGVGAMGRM